MIFSIFHDAGPDYSYIAIYFFPLRPYALDIYVHLFVRRIVAQIRKSVQLQWLPNVVAMRQFLPLTHQANIAFEHPLLPPPHLSFATTPRINKDGDFLDEKFGMFGSLDRGSYLSSFCCCRAGWCQSNERPLRQTELGPTSYEIGNVFESIDSGRSCHYYGSHLYE